MMPSRAWLGLSALIALLDQVTKHIAVFWVLPGQAFEVLSWLNIQVVYNTGVAFSFLAQADGWQWGLLVGLNVSLSAMMSWQLYKRRFQDRISCVAVSLALGGALGNLYDRIWQGAVTDFVDFHVGDWHFATFNLADSALCLGAGLWLLATWKGKANTANDAV